MTRLEAINTLLRSLGETGVTSLSTSHPRYQTLNAELDRATRRTQHRGWWFNKFDTAVNASTTVPANYVYARPKDSELPYVLREGRLWDPRTGSNVPSGSILCEVQTELAFESLPAEFQEYVVSTAALALAGSYDADELRLQSLTADFQSARSQVQRQHIRYYVLEKVSRRLQNTKFWWFNSYITDLPAPDNSTAPALPANLLFAQNLLRGVGEMYVRDGALWDRKLNAPVLGPVARVEVRVYVPFELLPPVFQDYVQVAAELDVARDFELPEAEQVNLAEKQEKLRIAVNTEHIRYSRHNLYRSGPTGLALALAYGPRYGRYAG